MNNPKLKAKISRLPEAPGVYLFKGAAGKIIYIGKAKSLKKRVGSYFSRGLSGKTLALVSNINDIEYKLCPSESMALILEAGLVHQYQPKYNISLRDNKSFPFVKITNEEFPAVCITRKKEADNAQYIGPYTNAKLLKSALRIIRRYFPYRSCKVLPNKACIYYRLGLSPAPCIGKITKAEYARILKNIRMILEGKTEALLKKLSVQMSLEAKARRFEEAARIRDQINALGVINTGRAGAKIDNKESVFYSQGLDELDGLRSLLGLAKLPLSIEAFDISNISGKEACGSMVSFHKGRPDKDNYRRFRIKTVQGVDDYAMLKEVVSRRYSRLLKENKLLPDLVLIDGGRAHLLVAEKELNRLGLNIPLISIAKDRENIYVQGKALPLRLEKDIPVLNLIRRIRDEAHRFAVAYHHLLRRKKIIGK